MKSIHTLSIITAVILLVSCNTTEKNKEAAPPQGKVKYEEITVASKIAGRIELIKVTEGQQVQKGDTLAIIGVPELNAKMEQANGAIEAAQGQLELAYNGATNDQLMQIQSQLDAANAQFLFAEQSLQRVQNMYYDSLIPAQQYDEVKAKYSAAKAQVNAIAAKQKEIKAGTRMETIKSAKGQVVRAVGIKNEILQANKERYIIAPADMLIDNIVLSEGELATPGYALFSGYRNNDIWFRFTIGEHNINAYPLGSNITISIPATHKKISARIIAVKQLPRYADNTSTAPNREVAEGFYELKATPANATDANGLYNNSSVLLLQ